MKRLVLALAAVFCLVACRKELGPEYTTAPEFGEVVITPVVPDSEQEVSLRVPITSQYGLHAAQTAYVLDDDPEKIENTAPVFYTKENTSVVYNAVIPKQKAGTKVSYQVMAMTPYGVLAVTPIMEYTVIPAPGEETEE